MLTCDVEDPAQTVALGVAAAPYGPFDGFVHSIAWANFSEGVKPFHETKRADFLQAAAISCFSFVELANALKRHLRRDASVVAISISSQVTTENYGYMAPIKAALDSSTRALAKSFSADTEVRFNTVNSGPPENERLGGHSGLSRPLFVRGKIDLSQTRGGNARGRRCRRLFTQPARQWHQRPRAGGERRAGLELFRPRGRACRHAARGAGRAARVMKFTAVAIRGCACLRAAAGSVDIRRAGR